MCPADTVLVALLLLFALLGPVVVIVLLVADYRCGPYYLNNPTRRVINPWAMVNLTRRVINLRAMVNLTRWVINLRAMVNPAWRVVNSWALVMANLMVVVIGNRISGGSRNQADGKCCNLRVFIGMMGAFFVMVVATRLCTAHGKQRQQYEGSDTDCF